MTKFDDYLTAKQEDILEKGYKGLVEFNNPQPGLDSDYTDLAKRKLIILIIGKDDSHMGAFKDTVRGRALLDSIHNHNKENKNKKINAIKLACLTAFLGFIVWILQHILTT